MAAEDGHVRLVIALFSGMTDIYPALNELSAVNVGNDQVCLAALSSVIDQIMTDHSISEALRNRTSPLFDRMNILPPVTERSPVMRASGWLLEALGTEVPEATTSSVLDAASWMPPNQRAETISWIADGYIVLSVRSDRSKQQQSATRILLRHSAKGVQTHEFGLPKTV